MDKDTVEDKNDNAAQSPSNSHAHDNSKAEDRTIEKKDDPDDETGNDKDNADVDKGGNQKNDEKDDDGNDTPGKVKDGESGEANDGPEEPPPPPDLGQVSEEIDKFMSDLKASDDDAEPSEVPGFVEEFAILVEAEIANYDSGETPVKWSQLNEDDASLFLEMVDRVSKLSNLFGKFTSKPEYAWSINRIDGLLQRAMSYLEDEFRSIVEDGCHEPDPNNTESKPKPASTKETEESDLAPSETTKEKEKVLIMGYTEEVVSSMNRLVKAILAGGHEWEISEAYLIARRNVLESELHKLGFEKFSIDDVQKMQWDSLEKEISAGIKTFKEFATVIFPAERKLAEAVFSDSPSIGENIFGCLSRGVTLQLLNFSEAVAMSKRSSEKLFKFLDIYETLRDLTPSIDSLFPEMCADELKAETTLTRGRFGDAVICIFIELENSIKADSVKTPVPGGAVHPLTRYTLNYLKYACEYKDTLQQVFKEHLKIERADSATRPDYDYNNPSAGGQTNTSNSNESAFENQLKKVMDLLDANIEAKSKLYKDPSLSSIFMMNNGRYALQKIKSAAEISTLLGDPWYRKRSSDLRQYHKTYQRETWMKLLQSLQTDGLIVRGKVYKPTLKERFKSFNAMFDEIHRTQSTWIVSDEQLQSELRVSIAAVVIPAYRSFVSRFAQTFTPGRQTDKYLKFQPDDIESLIEDLFEGKR